MSEISNITFDSINLHQTILDNIGDKGYTSPTVIQAKSIPVLLKGNDILGIAQTGTGKTASFSLPLIDRLARNKVELKEFETRALIMAPTRELVSQIQKNIEGYAEGLDIKSTVIIGGIRKEYQIEDMKNATDIIVATPGRLMDLMGGGHVRFNQLEVFVLDEADMMLDMGFLDDVKTISSKLPYPRQTAMFSATMPRQIELLAKNLLNNPTKVESAPQSSTIKEIEQKVYFVEEEDKLSLLSLFLEDDRMQRVLVFCKAKYGILNVVEMLTSQGISNSEIHSNLSQGQRDQAISDFSSGKVRVLVATDIASRGIDVLGVTHVVNFNMPDDATFYVHRIGRTARAGSKGIALSLCGERDLALLRNVQKCIKMDIPVFTNQPFHKEFPPLDVNRKGRSSSAQNRKKNRKKPSQAKSAAKKKFLENL